MEEKNNKRENKALINENKNLTSENKRLKLDMKKLNRQLTLATGKLVEQKNIAKTKEDLDTDLASEKSMHEKQLQAIMENSLDIIIILDSEMKYTLSTQSFLKLVDVPDIGFLRNKTFRQISSLFADDDWIDHMEKKIGKALETNEIQVSEDRFNTGGQNEARDYIVSVIPFAYSGDENDGLLVIFQDITERIQMEDRIKKALDDAMTASKAKGDFLSNMSHEMRTPMNAIIGMTAIGKKAESLAEKNQALKKIGDAASHLLGIINDILDMAKIEADKLELVPVEYNFERMLRKVVSVINFRLDEKRQQFTVNVGNSVPRFIVGDDQRLAQVITNLLSNAVKFTPEGGEINLKISLIEESTDGCELRIEVTDSGIGISQENQEKLFHAFEQADSGTSRKYGGTGLGLVISKRIVELMGGKIWYESEQGQGARFIFTVKAQRGNKSSRSLLLPGINWRNVRILAVDDVAEIRDQFSELFNHLEINCDVAADGFEACHMIEENGAYDIYFVDWHMPGMDGVELTRRIKLSYEDRQQVVIMITALDWSQIREEAVGAGVDKHLLKPLFSSSIIDCLNEYLDVESIRSNKDSMINADRFDGKRMLLAEDIEINREILIALLEGTGIAIDCAENGLEALDMIEAAPNKYDIVFMDMQMPKMDGLAATRRLRGMPALKGVKLPIIAMTANVFKDDIKACLEAGMDDHLGKPLDIGRVIEKLHKYL